MRFQQGVGNLILQESRDSYGGLYERKYWYINLRIIITDKHELKLIRNRRHRHFLGTYLETEKKRCNKLRLKRLN